MIWPLFCYVVLYLANPSYTVLQVPCYLVLAQFYHAASCVCLFPFFVEFSILPHLFFMIHLSPLMILLFQTFLKNIDSELPKQSLVLT